MKRAAWHSNHFKSIFRTVYFTSVTLLLIAVLFMYIVFQKIAISRQDSFMERFMANTYSSITYQISTSQTHALNASTSSNGNILFASQPSYENEKFVASKNVDYFISQDPMIHSVLFYNSSLNRIYMFGQDLVSSSADTFYDQEIVSRIRLSSGSSSKCVPRQIADSPYNTSVSLVLTSLHHLGSGNYVVINLDAEQVFSVFRSSQSVYDPDAIHYFVTYDRSQPIYKSGQDDQSLQNDILLEKLEANQWAESFNAYIDHVNYHFQVLEDSKNNLQMVSIIRQMDVSVSFLAYLIPLICILLVSGVVAAVVNVRVSSKLYSPIAQIRHTLSGEAGDGPREDENIPDDEIDDITRRITDRSLRLESLFSYKKRSLSLSQEIFLKNQLLYNKYSDGEFWEKSRQAELPYSDGDRFVLVYAQWFPIDPEDEPEIGDQGLLCFGLSNVVHELFDGQVNVKELPFEKDGMAFLFCFQSDASPSIDHRVLGSIQTIFAQYFELNLSFFISDPFMKPHAFCSTMQQLQELSGYQFFHENGCILEGKDVNTETLRTSVCPTPSASELESLIRAADWDGCEKMLDSYFQELNLYSRETAGASINVFVTQLITIFKRIESTCPSVTPLNYHQFYSQILAANTLAQVRDLICGQISDITQALAQEDHSSMGIVARDVLRFLEDNFQDITLSSKSVAMNFHVSVPYLNRIFKQKTGESISSYLKKLRLEHARTLLLETNKPVEVIAKNVGFENTKYFYSLFKAEYGISPNSYRTSGKNISE